MFEASQQQSFFNKRRKTLKNGRKQHLNKHKKPFVKGKQNAIKKMMEETILATFQT
jgi:hypothetical protein